MQLLEEIKAYPHRHDNNWTPTPPPPIDYCYIRPQHIASVNTLCREFFWPGIDCKLKVLWIFKNIFETFHDLNDSDEKTRMLKTAWKNSNLVKSYASFKIMQISILAHIIVSR